MNRIFFLAAAICVSVVSHGQGLSAAELFGYEQESCSARLMDDAKLKVLSGKFPFDVSTNPSLAILSNQSKPNAKEKLALSHFASELEKCQGGAHAGASSAPTELDTLRSAYRLDANAILVDLYAGKSTYGNYAKLNFRRAVEFRAATEAAQRDIERKRQEDELQQRKTAELLNKQRESTARQEEATARQEEAAARQAQERASQEERDKKRRLAMDDAACKNEASSSSSPSPTNQDSTTRCTGYGGSIDCQTRSRGGFAAGWALGESIEAKQNYYSNCMVARGWRRK